MGYRVRECGKGTWMGNSRGRGRSFRVLRRLSGVYKPPPKTEDNVMTSRKKPGVAFWATVVVVVAPFGQLWAADNGIAIPDTPRVHSYAVPASAALQEVSFDWSSRALLGRNGGLGTRPICVLVALMDPLDDVRPLYSMATCTHAYFGRTADELLAFDRALGQWLIHSRTNPARTVEGLELPEGATVTPLQIRRATSGNAVVGYSTVRLKSSGDFEYRTFVIDLATNQGKWGPNGHQPVFIGDSDDF